MIPHHLHDSALLLKQSSCVHEAHGQSTLGTEAEQGRYHSTSAMVIILAPLCPGEGIWAIDTRLSNLQQMADYEMHPHVRRCDCQTWHAEEDGESLKSPQRMTKGSLSAALLAPLHEVLLMPLAAADRRLIINCACACLAASLACARQREF